MLCIIVMFLLDSHYDGTHSLPLLRHISKKKKKVLVLATLLQIK